jgi:hypothetical protein
MDNVSRPLIALLLGSVAVFALWFVALKPSSSSTSAKSTGTTSYQSAINQAKQAVKTSNAASAAHGGVIATTPAAGATSPAAGATATTASPATTTTVTVAPATRHRLDVVGSALKANKVVAVLFYNPSAVDDQAVKQELNSVPTHGAQVVKLAAPLSELARYTVVTTQVPVNASPTLVLIDPDQQATTIVGFADRFEIAQRVSDALAVQ